MRTTWHSFEWLRVKTQLCDITEDVPGLMLTIESISGWLSAMSCVTARAASVRAAWALREHRVFPDALALNSHWALREHRAFPDALALMGGLMVSPFCWWAKTQKGLISFHCL